MLPFFLEQWGVRFRMLPLPAMFLSAQPQTEAAGRYQLPVLVFVGVIAVLIVCGTILPVFFQPKSKRKGKDDSKKS